MALLNRLTFLQQTKEEYMSNTIQYRIKSVYGNEMKYPANEIAVKFSELLQTKTFTDAMVRKIEALGFNFIQVL